MIFSPLMAEKVLSERKTVTRRPTKDKPCRYAVGADYAVQPGRGKKEIARIWIISVTVQTLTGVLIAGEPELEGFDSADEFRKYWTELYGEWGGFIQPVYRIEFELTNTENEEVA